MSFIFSLHTIQLKHKVNKKPLAFSSMYLHIKVLCPLLPYSPYTVYVGLGPAQEEKNHSGTLSPFTIHALHGPRRSRSRIEEKKADVFYFLTTRHPTQT